MALQWKREPWRKQYVREEGTFAALPLFTRALGKQLIGLVDDCGRIELGGREPWDAIAYRAGATRGDRRMLRPHVEALLAEGYLVREATAIRIRNFVPAQVRFDRVRGDHELSVERSSSGRDASATDPRQSRDPSTTEPRQSHEASTKTESSAGDSSIHVVASRSETIRNDPKREGEGEGGPPGDAFRLLANRVWQDQEDAKAALRAEGIDPTTRALSPLDPARSKLLHFIAAQAAAGGIEAAEADCRHVLAVNLADCRLTRTLKFMDGRHWDPPRAAAALSTAVGQPLGKPARAVKTERFHAVRDRNAYPDPETEREEFLHG